MKCSSMFRWSLKSKNYRNTAVYTIYWWSSVESSQNFSFIFFFLVFIRVNCLCCGWAVTLLIQLFPFQRKKMLQYCWKQRDWCGPSPCRGREALGALSFSLHVMLRWRFSLLECVLKWVTLFVCWHEKTSSWYSKGTLDWVVSWGPGCELLSHCLPSL